MQEERKKIVVEELTKLLEEWDKKSDDVLRRRELPVEHENHAFEDEEEWVLDNWHSLKTVLELL